jgi:chaperonin GroEL
LINFQTAGEVIPFLDYASEQGRPLVIVSSMEHDISNMILENVRKHKYPFCIIKPPYQGKKGRETMADLALVLDCEVLEGITRTNYDGKESLYLGTCERIEIGKKDTVITKKKDFDESASKGKIADLTAQIKLQDNEGEKNYLRERISKIAGGISTVLVGGVTPSEVEEKVARIDDAICAVRASKDGGVVAGGGITLMNATRVLTKEIDDVSSRSILAPLKKIMSNAGVENKSFHQRYPFGYDVKEYKEVDMFEAGILDTAKGIKNALINAVSASNNLLRTNNVVTLKRFAQNGK